MLWKGKKSELWYPGRSYIEIQSGKSISWVDVKSRERVSIHGRELASEKACVLSMG